MCHESTSRSRCEPQPQKGQQTNIATAKSIQRKCTLKNSHSTKEPKVIALQAHVLSKQTSNLYVARHLQPIQDLCRTLNVFEPLKTAQFFCYWTDMAFEIIKQTLHPLAAIVWGDIAVGRLGVPTVLCVRSFSKFKVYS